MRRIFIIFSLLLFVMATILAVSDLAMTGDKNSRKSLGLNKTFIIDRPFWVPNRIGVYISNLGETVSSAVISSAGLEWPVGSANTAHFQGGVWLVGIKNGEIVSASSEFVTEFQAGNVVNGVAANNLDASFKVYIINEADVANPRGNPDYMNWPVADGAPVNADGTPGLIGSSTAWAVFNDFSETLHNNLFNTKPMNVEVQMTAWAFNRPDAFGDMLFYKFKYINKGDAPIDSVFVGLWNDIDIGDALDLVACDTTLSLGYMYKTQADNLYGNNPPAVGMDFFQGPIVPSPGDTANVSGRKVPDFRNLPMTSFAKYINGGPPQTSDPETGPEAYNYMNGFDLLGDPVIDPTTGQVTKFYHAGDPVAGTGWNETTHADKRFLMNSGPFTLAVGDTQEVVFGIMIAQGVGGLQSVTLLKVADIAAQTAYDINFQLPAVPTTPVITVTTEETSIFLEWDRVAESYAAIDLVDKDSSGNATEYLFEGYNVYQLDSPVITAQTRVQKIATFDLINGVTEIRDFAFVREIGQAVDLIVQNNTDNGVQNFLRIDTDEVRGGVPLIQNRKYYFAVTAFGYNALGVPKALEGPVIPITVHPQSQPLGTDLTNASAVGDTLPSQRLSGPSDGGIVATVVDRTQLTGHTYEVRFRVEEDGSSVYDVVDVTTGETKAAGFSNQSDASGPRDYPVVDGVLVKVGGPALTFKNFETVSNAAGPIDPPEGAAADFQGFPSLRPTDGQQVGEGHWFVHTGDNGGSAGGGSRGSFAAYIDRVTNGQTRWPNIIPFDYEIRFTAAGGRGYEPGFAASPAMMDVPFELWNIGIGTTDDPSDDYRYCPNILDDGADGIFNITSYGVAGTDSPSGEHSASGGDDDPYTDWFYWYTPDDVSPGQAGYDAWVAASVADPVSVGDGSFFQVLCSDDNLRRHVLVNWNGGVTPPFNQDMPETGTIFRITTTKPNTPADVFSFNAVAPTRDDMALAREQVDLVNVFPNPYTGFNIEETNPLQRFVTFTHLSEAGATIQIFTILGELVRTLEHTNGTQFEQWDMKNDAEIPVASGIYVARIDMGQVGVKILKLAILKPEERLDIF